MKLIIDIPRDFERHFNNDKFKDSLKRTKNDIYYSFRHDEGTTGLYELELLDMLIEAFGAAEVIESPSPNRTPSPSFPSFYEEDYLISTVNV